MTLDFLIEIKDTSGVRQLARTIKPSEHLADPVVLRKLAIEKRYFELMGVDWGIVTEKEINHDFAKNIQHLETFLESSTLGVSEAEIIRARRFMQPRLPSAVSFVDLANQCDETLGLELGSALRICNHLVARKLWVIDLQKIYNPRIPGLCKEVKINS